MNKPIIKKACYAIACLLLFTFSCQNKPEEQEEVEQLPAKKTVVAMGIDSLESPVTASVRGIDVANDGTVWVGGSNGIFMKGTDGGKKWMADLVLGADSLQFRDIHGFNAQEAILMVAGQPARFYRTEDGGENWDIVYEHPSAEAFFDAISFWDDLNGIAFGDPIDGKLTLAKTTDGGRSWLTVAPDILPRLAEGEAGFAASGSSMAVSEGGKVWIGTGGTQASLLYSTDYGKNWEKLSTPMLAGEASTGIFSIDLLSKNEMVVVGGNYMLEKLTTKNAFLSKNGGKTWQAPTKSTLGYRSSVKYLSKDILLATGPSGTDYSIDSGENWQLLTNSGYHTIAVVPNQEAAWLAGANGRLAYAKVLSK